MSGNETYRYWTDRIYSWMKTGGLIRKDYSVADGIMADGSCIVNGVQWTYNSAELIKGLLVLYRATKNQSYLTEAEKHVSFSLDAFVNEKGGGELWDPSCIYNGGIVSCKNPAGYAWPLYQAYAQYFTVSQDQSRKDKIEMAMRSTAKAIFSYCDTAWNCIRILDPGWIVFLITL